MAGIDAVPIDAWEGEDRTYGAASCYGVTLVTGDERYEEVHAIVPDRTHHDDDQLELIAPERLRDALGLGDGDAVEVRVAATSRADTPKAMTWRRATTKTRPRGPRRDGGRLMRADADTDVDAVPGSDADSVNRALDAFRAGDPVCVHDFADREGETDIIYPAGAVDEAAVAHMRNDAGGLICVAVADSVADAFGLPFLADALDHPAVNDDPEYDDRSSFSLPVNHRETFTGITDEDRARTIVELAVSAAAVDADPRGTTPMTLLRSSVRPATSTCCGALTTACAGEPVTPSSALRWLRRSTPPPPPWSARCCSTTRRAPR